MLALHAYIEMCKNQVTLLTSAASTAYMQSINIHEGQRHACRAQIRMQARHLDSILIDTFLKRESDSGNPMPNTFVARDPSQHTPCVDISIPCEYNVYDSNDSQAGLRVELKHHQKS